ncbi:MAG: SRPBCC domain-containing protein [Pseudomonadota bacterium]
MTSENSWVSIEREFDAPIEVVWSMWTDPDHFKRWYGPMGMDVPVVQMDVRVGGTRKVCMSMDRPERAMKIWFTGVYKEVNAPNRLVYTESMCDENGTILSPASMGMPEDHPDITEVIIELREEDGKTHMKMVHVGVVEGTAGAGGWSQAFEKMSAYLATLG